MGAIYRIYNTETRQSYIGQHPRPYYRISEHLVPNRRNGSPAIQSCLLYHPPESWQWEIIADAKDYPSLFLLMRLSVYLSIYMIPELMATTLCLAVGSLILTTFRT